MSNYKFKIFLCQLTLLFTVVCAQNNPHIAYLNISDSLKSLSNEMLKDRIEKFELKFKNQQGYSFYEKLLTADTSLKKNELKHAMANYLEAFKLVEQDPDKMYVANFKIGSVHLLNDNLTLAATYYNKALLLKQGSFSTHLDFSLLFEMGLINSYLDNNKKSIEFYLKALNTAKHNKWLQKEAAMYNNIGLGYLKVGDTLKAKECLFMCLTKRLEIKDTLNYGQIFNNLGTYYLTIKDFENALQYFKKGLDNRVKYKAPFTGILESRVNIGKAYLKLRRLSEAQQVLNAALAESKQNNHLELERRALEPLILIYEEQKQFEKAYRLQKRYYFIKDSLYGLEKIQEMRSLTFQYDFNKKLQQDSLKYVEQDLLNKKQIEIQKEKNKTLYMVVLVVVVGLFACAFFIRKLQKSNRERAIANELISKQKEELVQKQKEITSSIHYAKRIQDALLPNFKYIKKHLGR